MNNLKANPDVAGWRFSEATKKEEQGLAMVRQLAAEKGPEAMALLAQLQPHLCRPPRGQADEP